uniref:Uncharacterized protein n=1 Tax=Metapenaeus joyneri majanivirus TaxID=2984280 RepID=A0A9C7CFC4_9VIRU|nr:MAG: hypothetical protein [Metapenaeus joyneri majanivirus]
MKEPTTTTTTLDITMEEPTKQSIITMEEPTKQSIIMNKSTIDLIMLTIPKVLHNKAEKIFKKNKENELDNYRSKQHNNKRTQDNLYLKSEENIEKEIKERVMLLNIADLIMNIWSSNMKKYAEKVILEWALKLNYFNTSQYSWIHFLEQTHKNVMSAPHTTIGKDNNDEYDNWVINDSDIIIIELVWNRFNMREHFEQTKSHRYWIKESYNRLKQFLPKLSQEIIDRHDISKFAFSQAVGYTLNWVHNIKYTKIYLTACNFHLYNEPHHPQFWGKKNMTEEYLQESLIDMIAVEWERKKKQDLDILLRDLAYMDYKFLSRYTPKQKKMVYDLINSMISADPSWRDIELSEKEKRLVSTIAVDKQPFIVCMIEKQRKNEIARLFRLNNINNDDKNNNSVEELKKKNTSSSSSSRQKRRSSTGDLTTLQAATAVTAAGNDKAYYISVDRIVTEFWNAEYKKYVQNCILTQAVVHGFIKETDIEWILKFDQKPIKGEESNIETVENEELILDVLWNDYNLKEFFNSIYKHRFWVQSYYKHLLLKDDMMMKEIPEEFIKRHDLSKLALSQSIGLTLGDIHKIYTPKYKKAMNRHLNIEPHHPEMWLNSSTTYSRNKYINKYEDDTKEERLKNWLHYYYDEEKKNDHMYGGGGGLDVSKIDFRSENMPDMFLKESFLDLLACKLNLIESRKYYDDDVLNQKLENYSYKDRQYITEMLKKEDYEKMVLG